VQIPEAAGLSCGKPGDAVNLSKIHSQEKRDGTWRKENGVLSPSRRKLPDGCNFDADAYVYTVGMNTRGLSTGCGAVCAVSGKSSEARRGPGKRKYIAAHFSAE
jgi:hypothetical protein